MTTISTKSQTNACPECGSSSGMQNQSFCSDCGYHPVAKQCFEGTEEVVRGPAVIGSIIVLTGVVLLGIAGLLGRIYIWESGEHHYWMRYLLIVGGATFLLGHIAAFWYSLVKNGIEMSDILVGPKSVWGPVLYDMHKKWIVASLGAYGLVTLVVAGGLFGVNFESYVGKESNQSVWKMIQDIQVALGKEPTEMPEISLAKLEGEIELPKGGDGKLVVDTDLSVLDPNNLHELADVLNEGGKERATNRNGGSFEELKNSMDVSLLADGATPAQGGTINTKKTFENTGSVLVDGSGEPSSTRSNSASLKKTSRPLKFNQVECFIFGYTTNEKGDLDSLVMGTIEQGEPKYVGLLPSRLIEEHHYQDVSLEFFKESTETPFVECRVDAKWLTPKAICVLEHQGRNIHGTYEFSRFVRFSEFL